jgi:protein TonB
MTALIQSARFASSVRTSASLVLLGVFTLALAACGNNNAPQNTASTATQPGAPATAPAAKPAPASTAAQQAQAQAEQAAQAKLDSMSVDQLLAAARIAMNQQKLVAPKGDNAFEYYEKALQKDPKNQVAQDALRESFPFGANAVESAIGQNNFDEAQREIGLLAKADPSNYTLTILRSKLDAAKKQQQREADQKAKAAAELAAKQAAAAKAAAEAAKAPPPVQQPVAQQAQPAPVQEAPKPTPPPQPVGETRAAQVVTPAAPEYPMEAARNQTSGYATVEFTVNPDGSVSNAHVIASQPRRVFDRAAIDAVSRSKFKPALKNGQPVSATLQRRIDFKFGG